MLAQFTGEALLLAAIGAVAGVAVGAAVARLLSNATRWQAAATPDTFAMAVSGALAAGVLFGAWPAWRAASMNPIDALRAA